MKEKGEDEKLNKKVYIGAGVLIGSLILVLILANIPWSTLYPPTTPTAKATTSVAITDWTTKEILGELCPFTMYGDKGQITEVEHIYDLTYYETISTGVMPNDFDKDISEYDYIIIRTNPDEATDGFWTTYDYLYPVMGGNYDFKLFAYHETDDVFGLPLNVADGTAWDLATNTNGTIALWFPTVDKDELHRGNYFRITDDLADLSQTTLDYLWNQRYHRSEPTLFTLTDDTADHTKTGDYATITETFAIEFEFNTTISTVDGNVDQVNFTADCDVNFLIEIDVNKLYFVTTESWDTFYDNFEMFFEVFTAINITCNTVKAGRVIIPKRFFSGGYTFTSDQTLATA